LVLKNKNELKGLSLHSIKRKRENLVKPLPVPCVFMHVLNNNLFLNYHQAKMDPSVDPECCFCLKDDQSSQHIVAECLALSYLLYKSFEKHILGIKNSRLVCQAGDLFP
jgi:hypothetical protein